MSERLRALSARRVIKKLEKAGFRKTHQRGSHVSLKDTKTGRIVVVPLHGIDIPIGSLRNIVILKQSSQLRNSINFKDISTMSKILIDGFEVQKIYFSYFAIKDYKRNQSKN